MQHAQQLGRYHLLDRVAFGGMAEIYRAKTADAQGRLHVVAVKRVLGHLCEDDEFIQMLIDEARLTALLKHPNIARVYEFSKVQSEYFISMEYVDGKDMRALLERARQNQEWLPEHLIAYIGMQVARGLHAAHMQTDRNGSQLNIVHRDVSPSNVLLSYGGDVKLCDFGIAKASGTRSQTKTGVIKGKVKYMSPEQAMGRKLDHRSDLFSLGTLLYEMLTLQAPFTATTEIELLFAVRDARKRPIRELRPNLHAELEIVIDRAMAKSRSQRFQNGEEFANSLQAFLDAHYPNQGVAALSQYLRAAFAKEIERENAVLADYIIDGAKVDANVGENLLADVLGPDAEYTQFTAAFSQEAAEVLALPPAPPGNPNQKMRVLSEVTMPGAEEFDAMPTAQKARLSAEDLGIPEPIPDWGPSAQTMPRAVPGPAAARPAAVAMQLGDSLGDDGEPGQQTVVLMRQTPPQGVTMPVPAKAPLIPGLPDLAFDDHIHVEETRILPRSQMESLAPAPVVRGKDGLHDASTQILDARNLPPELQQLLQKRGAAMLAASQAPVAPPLSAGPPPPPPPPAKPLPAKMPSLELTPLDHDFHEASTAYLDWSPLSPETGSELPMPDSSSLNALAGVGQPLSPPPRAAEVAAPPPSPRPFSPPPAPEPARAAEPEPPAPPRAPTGVQPGPRPLGPQSLPPRSATGLQAPVAPRPTGMQAPVAPRPTGMQAPVAPRPTGMQAPVAPRPASAQEPPTVPRSAPVPTEASPEVAAPPAAPLPPVAPRPTGMQAPVAPRPTGLQAPVVPRPTGLQAPIVPRPTGLQAPVVPRPTGLQHPIRSLTGLQQPIPVPHSSDGTIVPTKAGPGPEDEWESLPHLDSTLLSHPSGGGAGPAVPPVAIKKPSPGLRDRGDLPTLQPAEVARGPALEASDHTITNGELVTVPGASQFEDLPTPVKGTPAPRDLGFEADSEFAEDTNKGDGPRGMVHPGGDASMELSDDDFEALE
jgi:serine/threonine-protein kinase